MRSVLRNAKYCASCSAFTPGAAPLTPFIRTKKKAKRFDLRKTTNNRAKPKGAKKMMYEEFNRKSQEAGFSKVSYEAFKEAEEIYMQFTAMTKEQIVKLY